MSATHPLGPDQVKALEWLKDRGGFVVAPKGDKLLRSLERRGLVTRSNRPELCGDDDLLDYGLAPSRANRKRGWHRWTLKGSE